MCDVALNLNAENEDVFRGAEFKSGGECCTEKSSKFPRKFGAMGKGGSVFLEHTTLGWDPVHVRESTTKCQESLEPDPFCLRNYPLRLGSVGQKVKDCGSAGVVQLNSLSLVHCNDEKEEPKHLIAYPAEEEKARKHPIAH